MSTQERQQSNDKMLETVRKLLAKAEGTTVQAEADTFLAKAQELMERYAIDQALLDATRPADKQAVPITIDIRCINWHTHREFYDVQVLLISTLCRYSRCKMWHSPSRSTVHVAGFDTDARYVEMLFTSLYLQMESRFASDVKITPPTKFKGKKSRGKVTFKVLNADALEEVQKGPNYRIEYMRGFTVRIGERMQEMHNQSGPGTELVLANLESRVDNYVDSLGLRLSGYSTRQSTYDEQARNRGANAANRANLRPTSGLRSTPELGS